MIISPPPFVVPIRSGIAGIRKAIDNLYGNPIGLGLATNCSCLFFTLGLCSGFDLDIDSFLDLGFSTSFN